MPVSNEIHRAGFEANDSDIESTIYVMKEAYHLSKGRSWKDLVRSYLALWFLLFVEDGPASELNMFSLYYSWLEKMTPNSKYESLKICPLFVPRIKIISTKLVFM